METATGIVTCPKCGELLGLIPRKPLAMNSGSSATLELVGTMQMVQAITEQMRVYPGETTRALQRAGELALYHTLRKLVPDPERQFRLDD